MRPLILTLIPTFALAQGFALGPDPELEWEGNINYAATGATLLNCPTAVQCGLGLFGNARNCEGLASATAPLTGVPEGATIRYAQLRWAASTPAEAALDAQVTLTAPYGTDYELNSDPGLTQEFQDQGPAEVCAALEALCPADCRIGAYSTGADITEALNQALEDGEDLNGDWTLSDVEVAGANENDRATAIQAIGSLAIGAWSMFVVYETEADPQLRRIYYYQGFELLEGVARDVRPRGFLAPARDPTVTLTFAVLEGDAQIQGDSLLVNGNEVANDCNPNRNTFNSTISSPGQPCRQGVQGLDLDTFVVQGAIDPGAEEATITFRPTGEQLFTDWLVLAFDHVPPSFESVKPQKASQPPSRSVVGQGDRIEYTIIVENSGGDFATNVVLIDPVPNGTTYVSTSAAIDGQAIGDGPEGTNPFERGFNLSNWGNIGRFDPGERHVATFVVTVNESLDEGDVIQNVAAIRATELAEDATTEQVVHFVGVVPDGGIPPAPDVGLPDPDAGAPMDTSVPPPPEQDAGPCGPGMQPTLAGSCEPIPDMAAGCPESDSPCGPGTTLVEGICQSICSAGLVWDQNCGPCGQCRHESQEPCSLGATEEGAGGGGGGCGCRAGTGDSHSAAWAWLLVYGALRRRRRRASTAGTDAAC